MVVADEHPNFRRARRTGGPAGRCSARRQCASRLPAAAVAWYQNCWCPALAQPRILFHSCSVASPPRCAASCVPRPKVVGPDLPAPELGLDLCRGMSAAALPPHVSNTHRLPLYCSVRSWHQSTMAKPDSPRWRGDRSAGHSWQQHGHLRCLSSKRQSRRPFPISRRFGGNWGCRSVPPRTSYPRRPDRHSHDVPL